jgi:hypothetical protein
LRIASPAKVPMILPQYNRDSSRWAIQELQS